MTPANEPTPDVVEAVAKALAEHWRDMHTNESLGLQRMLARHAITAYESARGDDEFETLVIDLSESLAMFDAGEADADDVVTNLRNSLGRLQ